MASISNEAGRLKIIYFIDATGKRRKLRLGNVPRRVAETVLGHVEQITAAQAMGAAIPADSAKWLAALDDKLYRRLVKAGLAQPRAHDKSQALTLGEWLDQFLAGRDNVKDSTQVTYGNAKRNLLDLFAASRPLSSITEGDADEWREHLQREGLSENTIRRRTGIARQVFRRAVRKKLIASNPFEGLPVTVRGNPSRDRFITRDEAQRIMDACPTAEWKLLFALSRFGGLRCPSEHLALRWEDVSWERGRITVHSPKTERHPGGESRQIPMFPELLPHLQAVFEPPGEPAKAATDHVITGYRDATQNLRTQFTRIIKRAGLAPWPKLFHNLRATRATELVREFPEHVVTEWMGHSVQVAREHYLQVTDDHFAAASKAGQKAGQQNAADSRKGPPSQSGEREETASAGKERGFAVNCGKYTAESMGVTGLEPVTSCV